MPTATTQADDRPVLLLDPTVWIPHMRKRGYPTVTAQAEAVGCYRTHLSELLSGKVSPGPTMARTLVNVAELPPRRLFKLADA
jgi:hypothetical protein